MYGRHTVCTTTVSLCSGGTPLGWLCCQLAWDLHNRGCQRKPKTEQSKYCRTAAGRRVTQRYMTSMKSTACHSMTCTAPAIHNNGNTAWVRSAGVQNLHDLLVSRAGMSWLAGRASSDNAAAPYWNVI